MSNAESPSNSPQPPKHVNPFLKAIMLVFVFIAMAFHEPAKYLRKRVYDSSAGGFLAFLGVIASLGAGIGAGYYLGWMVEAPVVKWLGGGVIASVLTWFYVWPTIYLLVFRKAFELSEELWKLVPSPKSGKSSRTGWFSELLVGLGYVAAVGGAVVLGWNTMHNVHDYLDWGFFGYAPGLIVGAIAGLIVGAFAVSAVSFLGLFVVALASGAALIYLGAPWTESVVTGFGLTAPYVKGAYAVEGVLWMAYIFPLAHLVIGNCFRFVVDIFDHLEKLLNSVYEEQKGGYREFAMQVSAIGAATGIAYHSLAVWALVGASYSITIVLACLLGFAAYLILGSILNRTGAVALGIASAGGSGYLAFTLWGQHQLWLGVVGQGAAAVVSAVAVFFLVFPIAYALVRLVAKPLLASWLRDPLVKLHEVLSEEIGHAFSRTYLDQTEYRDLFLHATNIVAGVGLAYAAYLLSAALGFGVAMTAGTVILTVGLSYMLVGKLLLKAGNYLVGVLTGLAVGVFAGTIVYAGQSAGLYAAIPAGLVVAAAVFGIGFPLVYVVVRAAANFLAATRWLKPVLVTVYEFFWNLFAALWREFLETYKRVYDSIKPYFGNFRQTWVDTWESVRQSFSKWR
ncbi:MAG: hypothetical protein H6677_01190 [Candidatus Obscuribacterales bacterium]|nr:hypothetical protein [Candidatus Obscuribacterales bacterium]